MNFIVLISFFISVSVANTYVLPAVHIHLVSDESYEENSEQLKTLVVNINILDRK